MNAVGCAENNPALSKRESLSHHHPSFKDFCNLDHVENAMGAEEAHLKEEYREHWMDQLRNPQPMYVPLPRFRPDVDYIKQRIREQKVLVTLRLPLEEVIGTEDQPIAQDVHTVTLKAKDVMPFACQDASHRHQHYIVALLLTSVSTSMFPEGVQMELDVTSTAFPVGLEPVKEEPKTWLRHRAMQVHNKREQVRRLGYVIHSRTHLQQPEYWFTAPRGTWQRHFHILEALRAGFHRQVRFLEDQTVLLPAQISDEGVPANFVTAMVLREWKAYRAHHAKAALPETALPRLMPDQHGLIIGQSELKAITQRVAEMMHVQSGLWQSDLHLSFRLLDFEHHWAPMLRMRPRPAFDLTVNLELVLYTVVLG